MVDALYREEFRTFNKIGNRLKDLSFRNRPRIDGIAVVLVTHSMFTAMPLIDAVEGVAGRCNMYLVCKSSSKNGDFERYITGRGNVILSSGKKDFKENPDKVIRELRLLGKPLLLLDHGGYGAYHIQELQDKLEIVGIVEYSLNGHERYGRSGISEHMDYISIAESETKKFADYSCGRFIGELCSFIVQQFSGFGNHMRGIRKIGIIGVGRLGLNAADQMKNNGAHNIMIYDINPERMIEAQQRGHNIQATCVEDILKRCNVILVGSDTAPIKPEMYELMHNHTIVATVTSPDDSLGIQELIHHGHIIEEERFANENIPISTYQITKEKYIHLICNGNAPNLTYSQFGVDDPTLAMPLILHALAGYELARNNGMTKKQIQRLEERIMKDYLKIHQEFARETEDYWRSDGAVLAS
uniref:NADP oxidoreductase coenzyme F420-dependent n=1 Tax=Candidatus Kentrum sp. LPFa TaxID=2126335 RepID=A0A450W7L9_9GAMM|nr:MAG: NADP oxidoreductase coenzyme F420-dependent [Candidatus Kentron sp. LPFa]